MKSAPAQDLRGERERFVSELFHALSQPLTGLRCLLEVALRQPALSLPESRCALEQALDATERLYQSVLFIRQLAEAERTPPLTCVRLDEVLREAYNEILPVAESLEVEVSYSTPACATVDHVGCPAGAGNYRAHQGAEQDANGMVVRTSAEIVSRALFLVVDYALREMRAKDGLWFSVLRQGASAVVRIERRCDRALGGFELAEGLDVPAAQRGLALALCLLSSVGAQIDSDGAGKWIEIGFRRVDGGAAQEWNLQSRGRRLR